MGLKLSDAIRLSWSNIAQHKARSAIIILTISIIFGLLMGVNFILRGLESSLISASVTPTSGKVYLQTKFTDNRFGKAEDRLTERLAKYHGQIIGTYTTYNEPNLLNLVSTISASAAQDFLTTDLSQIPARKVPLLLPAVGLEQLSPDYAIYPEYQALFTERSYPVGTYPVTYSPYEKNATYDMPDGFEVHHPLALNGFNPLNLVLTNIWGSGPSDFPLLVADPSGHTAQYVREQIAKWRQDSLANYEFFLAEALKDDPDFATPEEIAEEREYILNKEPASTIHTVALFDSPADAIAFASPYDTPEYASFEPIPFSAGSLFTNTTGIADTFRSVRQGLNFIEVVLLVTAVIITTFTFAHIIDQDAATVALYRSMGASTGHIYLIYFFYILELCLLAIITSLIIGLVLSLITALTSSHELSVRLLEYYRLQSLPHVSFVGLDINFFIVILAIILVAPLTLVTTRHRFSSKHVARKLKEDQ